VANGDYQQRLQDEARQKRAAAAAAKAAKAGRDGGPFVAWLAAVQRSPGWRMASHTARSLLMDMLHSGPNGALTASAKYLAPLGWTSASTVTRCLRELIACGLLHETRKGRRPNVAACFAATWMDIRSDLKTLDPEAVRAFRRGAYMEPEQPAPALQRKRTAAATAARQVNAISRAAGYTLTPSDGVAAPSHYTVQRCNGTAPTPSDGAMRAASADLSTPLDGAYLEIAIPEGGDSLSAVPGASPTRPAFRTRRTAGRTTTTDAALPAA
jgi:hypothetical protein